MNSHFAVYLKKVPLKNIQSSLKFIKESKTSIGMLGRIFNDYPHNIIFFEPHLVKPMLTLLHRFIMSSSNFEDEPNESSTGYLKALINLMTKITCAEMLDEEGNIKAAILDIFTDAQGVNELKIIIEADPAKTTEENDNHKKQIIRQILLSYFSQFLTLHLIDEWKKDKNLQAKYFLKHVNIKELALYYQKAITNNELCFNALSAINVFIQQTPSLKDRLSKGFNTLRNKKTDINEAAKLLASEIWNAQTWKAIEDKAQEEKIPNKVHQTYINELVSLYALKAKNNFKTKAYQVQFESSISSVLNQIAAEELLRQAGYGCGYFTMHLERKNSEAIDKFAHDYRLYGRPLITSFRIQSVKSLHVFFFSKRALKDLTFYFDNLIRNAITDRSTHNFVIKILFFVFSRLYTPQGNLRPEVLRLGRDLKPESLKHDLTTKMVGIMTSRVVYNWLSSDTNQFLYLNHCQQDIINDSIKKITYFFKLGTDSEFLKQVRGFPFIADPRTAEANFEIAIALKLNKKTVQLNKKLYNIKLIINKISQICLRQENDLKQIEDYKNRILLLKKNYTQYKEIFYLISDINHISDALARVMTDLTNATNNINFQYTTLKELKNHLASNKHNQQFNVGIQTAYINKIKKTLDHELLQANNKHIEIENLIRPLLVLRDSTLPEHTIILNQVKDIFNNETYWHERVRAGGGERLVNLKVPTGMARMGVLLNANKYPDPDIYLYKIIDSFENYKLARLHNHGFFHTFKKKIHKMVQSPDTSYIYGKIDELRYNFFKKKKLQSISHKLEVFKLQQQNKL